MSMRQFVGTELDEDTVRDDSTILRFRHLWKLHSLIEPMFAEVGEFLEEERLLMWVRTIVDATIFQIQGSTRNQECRCDPGMRQTRKDNARYVAMTIHMGTDVRGVVYHVSATDAAQADTNQLRGTPRRYEGVLYDTGVSGIGLSWSMWLRVAA